MASNPKTVKPMTPKQEIRLRVMEKLIPIASQHGITDSAVIIGTARGVEKYILEGYTAGSESDNSEKVA